MSAVNKAVIGFRLNEMMGKMVFVVFLIPFLSIGQKHRWDDQPYGQYFRNLGVDIWEGNKNFCIIAPDGSTSLLNSECSDIVQRLWMMRKSKDSLFLQTSVFCFSFEEGQMVSSVPPDRFMDTGFHSANELVPFCMDRLQSDRFELRAWLFYTGSNVNIGVQSPSGVVHKNHKENYLLPFNRFTENFVGALRYVGYYPARKGKWYAGDDRFVVGSMNGIWLYGAEMENNFGVMREIHCACSIFDNQVVLCEKDMVSDGHFEGGTLGLCRFHLTGQISFYKSIQFSAEAGPASDCRKHHECVAFEQVKQLKNQEQI